MNDFVKGESYKLDDIRKNLGGPLLSSIATRGNQILYVKFKEDRKLNPNLPKEVWIQNGPKQIENAQNWLAKKDPTMMFYMPKESNKWQYFGLVVVKLKAKDKEAAGHSGSDKVSMILSITTV